MDNLGKLYLICGLIIVFIDRAKVIMEILKSDNIDTIFMGDFLNKIH